jgi:general secretion pathway protein C
MHFKKTIVYLGIFMTFPLMAAEGYKILSMEKGSIYQQLGLKKGDIIKSVNGKKLTTDQDAKSLYELLKTTKKIDLVLVRKGKSQELHYDVK